MAIAAPRLVLDLRPHKARERATTCTLVIHIDGVAVWPVRCEEDARIEIQIDDLLAHLTEFWKPLMLRQVYPIDVSPLRPSDLRREQSADGPSYPQRLSKSRRKRSRASRRHMTLLAHSPASMGCHLSGCFVPARNSSWKQPASSGACRLAMRVRPSPKRAIGSARAWQAPMRSAGRWLRLRGTNAMQAMRQACSPGRRALTARWRAA